MIDIHCHILPKVDDGAVDIEEAIEMAKIASEEGIKKIVCTPHYSPDFEFEKGEVLQKYIYEFKDELKSNNIDIELILGNELYYTNELIEEIHSLDFFTINKSKYILIEFSTSNYPKDVCDIIYEIKIKGYIPIIAHVERYEEVHKNPNLIYDYIKEGALIQINASSILGKGGKDIKNICDILISNNMVHVVGTDAHSATKRRPLMLEAFNYTKDKYGENIANDLFINNSKNIIENNDIMNLNCTKYIEKKSLFKRLFKR